MNNIMSLNYKLQKKTWVMVVYHLQISCQHKDFSVVVVIMKNAGREGGLRSYGQRYGKFSLERM